MAKIQPLGDHVLIKPSIIEEKTLSGIVLPDSAKEKAKQGEVIAIGSGKYGDGKLINLEVKVGQTVLYSWGDEIKIDGEEFVLVSESSIQAVIER